MKSLDEMLRSLADRGTTEFAIASERLPCVKRGGAFEPVDDAAPSTDAILQMLMTVGGSRYVDALGPKPLQWSTRVEGVGTVGVTAMMRDDVVQARFVVQKRDERAAPHATKVSADVAPSGPGAAHPHARELELDLAAERASAVASRGAGAPRSPAAAPNAPTRRDIPNPFAMSGPPLDREAKTPVPGARRIDSPSRVDAAPPTRAFGSAPSRSLAELLAMARAANASDLHVIAARPPLLRVAGELSPHGEPVDAAFMERVVHGIVPPRLVAALDLEGSCDFALVDEAGAGARGRVNVTRQRTGYKVSIRLIPAEVPTLASLGLPDAIARATHHHQGLILVTGPTGHGKTSTLAAIVDLINRETTHHVITVEDPIEHLHPRKKAMMSQREVGTHTRTFASALKGSLREDPDVIVVGELRDTETVRMALSASETGHLVIGTMNTPSAAKTIDRVIDLFPPSDQAQVRTTLAGGLRLVLSQRLVPNSDRSGLVAAVEMLPGSISLWSLIRDSKTFQIPSLQQRGKAFGIVRLDDSLADLVKAGRTTLALAKPFAESPDELEANVLGKRPPIGAGVRPPEPTKPLIEVAGLLGKAGALFRKGGG